MATSSKLKWALNIWMGVSVESEKYRGRIDDLRSTGARLKLLSLQPLLGPLHDLSLDGIDWVIVGGESGHRARSMDPTWVFDLREQCQHARVPFFFKQWGGKNKKRAGRLFEGRPWDQIPTGPTDQPGPYRSRRIPHARRFRVASLRADFDRLR
jgi:protein gp37